MKARKPPKYRPNFALYEHLKAAWIAEHPGATPAQYQDAIRAIAKKCGI